MAATAVASTMLAVRKPGWSSAISDHATVVPTSTAATQAGTWRERA